MRDAISSLSRFIVTPTTSKHRVFVRRSHPVLPDHQLVVFARDDDYFFGVLHSHLHEVWAWSQGTQLREKESGFRYTPTTCFETFPLPRPTEEQRVAIAQAAKELDDLRTNWLNPPEWAREEVLEFPGSVDGPWARYIHDPNEHGIGTVKYPRLVPKGDKEAEQLAKRTLTNEAVFAAYGWKSSISDDEVLTLLLALNQEQSSAV